MDYTLHQLNVFIKVAKNQSVTKASEELHLTQPAVSIQLKKLQDQFEIPLIEVIGRQIYVTDFGKEIVKSAEKILQEVGEIRQKTLAYRGLLTGQLKVSIVSTGKYVMPFFLNDFLQQNAGVELNMDVTNRAQVINSLEKNQVDFSLVSVLPENLNVDSLSFLPNKLYMVRKYTGAKKSGFMQIKSLEKVPLIYREKGSATRSAMERYIALHKIPSKKTMEMTSNEAVKQAVLAGMGYSIMPLIGIKNELQNDELEIIHLKGLPLRTDWNLIWLKEKKLSPIAAAYLKFMREHITDLVHRQFYWYEAYGEEDGEGFTRIS